MALNEGQYTAEFLVSEAPGEISRDNVTVAVPASTTLAPGQVLAIRAADSKWIPFDDAATDGGETATGVLYSELANSGVSEADKAGVVINWSAEVRASGLVWGSADSAVGLPQLAALGIKAR